MAFSATAFAEEDLLAVGAGEFCTLIGPSFIGPSYLTAASMAFSRSTKSGAHFMMRVSCRSISGRTFVRYACHSASESLITSSAESDTTRAAS